MKTVALPIENKVRELDGKFWLSLNLAERGYKVVLGPSWDIKPAIDIIKPDVYLTKDPGDGNVEFFKKLQDSGILVCGLPPEGGFDTTEENYLANKQQSINFLDAHFVWGEKEAQMLKNCYKNISKKIKITGNPRFDLLNSGLRSVYADVSKEIRNKYGNFILFNSNFNRANTKHRNKRIKNVRDNYSNRNPVEEEKQNMRVLYSFFELILYLTTTDINRNIIIRPHPDEDHSTYHQEFKHFSDIHVKHKGDVRPWIYASDGVIHHNCTTGIEAAMMNKPVLSYNPFSHTHNNKSLPLLVSQVRSKRENVKKWLTQTAIPGSDYHLDKQQKSKLKQYFKNVDQPAAPLICETIDELVEGSGGYTGYKMGTEQRIERYVKTSPVGPTILKLYDIIRDAVTDGEHQLSRQKTKQKFPEMRYGELEMKFEIMKDKLPIESISIGKISQTKYTYVIKKIADDSDCRG